MADAKTGGNPGCGVQGMAEEFLLGCPCVAKTEGFRDWAIAFCKSIQDLMEVFRIDPVREFLGGFDIRDFQESIIVNAVRDSLLLQYWYQYGRPMGWLFPSTVRDAPLTTEAVGIFVRNQSATLRDG